MSNIISLHFILNYAVIAVILKLYFVTSYKYGTDASSLKYYLKAGIASPLFTKWLQPKVEMRFGPLQYNIIIIHRLI